MAIIDIRGKGGKMPEPDGDEKHPEGDPVTAVERAYFRGETLKAFKRGAGMDEKDSPALVPVRENLDIGTVVKAQAEQVTGLIGHLVEMVKNKPEAAESPMLKFVLEELRDVRARADNAPDPLVYLAESQDRLGAITQKLRTSLGLGEGPARAGVQDVAMAMQLEEMKLEREERSRRYETERDERRNQWARENARWDKEFELRLKEFDREQESRQSNTDMFGDLIASVMEGLKVERGVAAAAPGPAPAPRPSPAPAAQELPVPQPFPCPECGNPVTPPANLQPGQELPCPHCEAMIKMQVVA